MTRNARIKNLEERKCETEIGNKRIRNDGARQQLHLHRMITTSRNPNASHSHKGNSKQICKKCIMYILVRSFNSLSIYIPYIYVRNTNEWKIPMRSVCKIFRKNGRYGWKIESKRSLLIHTRYFVPLLLFTMILFFSCTNRIVSQW